MSINTLYKTDTTGQLKIIVKTVRITIYETVFHALLIHIPSLKSFSYQEFKVQFVGGKKQTKIT